MSLLLDVFVVVTLPIVALIVIGYLVQRRVDEARTVLSFVYANVVLPAFMVHFLSTLSMPLADMWPVVWFTLLQSAVVGGVGWGIALRLGLARELRPLVAIGGVFANTGNFGVPLAILAFPPEFTAHQAIIAAITAIVFVPLCSIALAPQQGGKSFTRHLGAVALNPIVVGVAAGLALRASGIALPQLVMKPLGMLASAYTCIALMALGAALHGGKPVAGDGALRAILLIKLLVSPAITWALAAALGFSGVPVAVFVVAASMPTAALVGVIAARYGRGATTATSAVLLSTLFAPIVVTVWIYATRLIIS